MQKLTDERKLLHGTSWGLTGDRLQDYAVETWKEEIGRGRIELQTEHQHKGLVQVGGEDRKMLAVLAMPKVAAKLVVLAPFVLFGVLIY